MSSTRERRADWEGSANAGRHKAADRERHDAEEAPLASAQNGKVLSRDLNRAGRRLRSAGFALAGALAFEVLWITVVGLAWPVETDSLLMFLIQSARPCVVALIVFDLIRPRSDGLTRCGKCGYILKGISEPRCPECGKRI